MNTRIIIVALTAAALTAACDPYDKVPGGGAQIVSVFTSQSGQLGGPALTINASNTAGTWALPIPTDCSGGAIAERNPLIFVAFSRLVNGASIQASAVDCTPANNWLTVTGAAGTGNTWYSCYNPQSTVPGETSYAVIFAAPTGGANGWGDPAALDGATTNTPYTFRGNVLDQKGNQIPVAIDATLQFPAVAGLAAGSGHCSAPSTTVACSADADCDTAGGETCTQTPGGVFLSWAPPGCSTTVTGYRIERAPNLVYSPGDYAVVVDSQTTTTFTDTGLTASQFYWYRVIPLQGATPNFIEGSLSEVEGQVGP